MQIEISAQNGTSTWNANHQLVLCPNVDVVSAWILDPLQKAMHSNLFQFTYTPRYIWQKLSWKCWEWKFSFHYISIWPLSLSSKCLQLHAFGISGNVRMRGKKIFWIRIETSTKTDTHTYVFSYVVLLCNVMVCEQCCSVNTHVRNNL